MSVSELDLFKIFHEKDQQYHASAKIGHVYNDQALILHFCRRQSLRMYIMMSKIFFKQRNLCQANLLPFKTAGKSTDL